MAFNVNIPATNESFYTPDEAKLNQEKINSGIIPKYGSLIKQISKITRVPEQLITGIIFIESTGNPNAQSPYASGLMQLSPSAASDVLIREKGLGRLEEPESVILKKYLGNRWKLIENVKPKQTSIGKTFITKEDLYKPQLCILIGAILLGQLMDEFNENGNIRLDKLIAIYNGGRFSRAAKKIIPFKGSTEGLIAISPKETANYIKKLIGKNSIMEILI